MVEVQDLWSSLEVIYKREKETWLDALDFNLVFSSSFNYFQGCETFQPESSVEFDAVVNLAKVTTVMMILTRIFRIFMDDIEQDSILISPHSFKQSKLC